MAEPAEQTQQGFEEPVDVNDVQATNDDVCFSAQVAKQAFRLERYLLDPKTKIEGGVSVSELEISREVVKKVVERAPVTDSGYLVRIHFTLQHTAGASGRDLAALHVDLIQANFRLISESGGTGYGQYSCSWLKEYVGSNGTTALGDLIDVSSKLQDITRRDWNALLDLNFSITRKEPLASPKYIVLGKEVKPVATRDVSESVPRADH